MKTYSIDTAIQYSRAVRSFTYGQADRKVLLAFAGTLFPQLDRTMRAVVELGNPDVGER